MTDDNGSEKKKKTHHYWNHRQQALASILFDKTIDPIVRRLLLLDDLGRRQRLSPQHHDQQNQQGELLLLRKELERRNEVKKVLHTLRLTLSDIVETINIKNEEDAANNNNNDDFANCNDNNVKVHWQSRVINQLCGIAVPLFNVLQQQQQPQSQPQSKSNDQRRMHCILQSATYACMEEAALSTIVLWRCRQNTINDDKSNDNSNNMNSLVLPGLVSCALALSSLDIANGGLGLDKEALDRGEECAVAILRCLQSFLCSSSSSSSSPPLNVLYSDSLHSNDINQQLPESVSPMAKEIGDAMGGSLVARLVQSCLEFLPKESVISEPSSNKSNNSLASLQLEALKTLQILMTSIPIVALWKAILPGCFAGLYRCALSKRNSSSASSTHKVASEAIFALSLLLRQSMKNENSSVVVGNNNSSHQQSLAATLMAAVEKSKLPVKTNEDLTDVTSTTTRQSSVSEIQDLEFKNEVNARLPGPLSVLLSLISADWSLSVKKRGLVLCHVILVETQSMWTESTANTLEKKALEYCLTNLNDDEIDECLPKYSCRVLHEYKSQLGTVEWKKRLSQSVVPTILNLLEMLPILAKSGRDMEVRNNLRIIDGYLLISFRGKKCDDVDQTRRSLGKGKSDVGEALSCLEAAKMIKEAFSVIFAPDIESITFRPLVETFSPDGNKIDIIGDHTTIRFLYLKETTINSARQTVRLFARTFGTKRCAFIIDACIADMFESWSRKYKQQHIFFTGDISSAQLTWSGCCIYCAELLRGLLKLGQDVDARITPTPSKRTHVLTSLASSVFPVIVSDPLWNLPTALEGEPKTTKSPSFSNKNAMIESMGGGLRECENSSIKSINANAILLCTLIGFISQFARVLGKDIKLHLPIILLPLLERASGIGNHAYVQNCAVTSLGVVSESADCSGVYCFLATNFDYLLDAVSIRVRKYAKERSTLPRSMMGVIDLVLRSAICSGTMGSHLSIVDHMLTCLLNYFDRQYDAVLSQQSYLDTICVFRSIISFVDESITEQTGSISLSTCLDLNKHVNEVNGWVHRLDDELKLGPTVYLSDGDGGPADQANNCQEDEDGSPNDNDEHTTNHKKIDYTEEIRTVNAVLSRCSYLISSDILKIQMLGCEPILAGFRCLWKIGTLRTSQQGESASNPLLPAIAQLWPTIIRRLRAASSLYASLRRKPQHNLPLRHAIAKDQDFSSAQTCAALISKYLEIISELCNISDGFFSDRFENDVYPILARLLESDERGNLLLEDCRHSLSAKPHSFLLSVLLCLKLTFESSCGRDLAGLIPSSGSMILPLLSDDHIGDAAVETIKAMLKVDSDALWRGLHKLSARSFPCNPLHRILPTTSDELLVSPSQHGLHKDVCITAIRNAEKLLSFIDSLAEQPVC